MNASRLLYNAGMLASIQFLNLSLPIVTAPVVARAFGPTTFGVIATLTAFCAYVGQVTSFGFHWAGPRTIANLRDDHQQLSRAISEIMAAQLILAAAASLLFACAAPCLPFALEYKAVTFLVLTQAITYGLTPQWAFLGMDCLTTFIVTQAVVRLTAAAAVLTWIRSVDDLLVYVLINAAASALTLVAGILVLRAEGVMLSRPPLNMIVRRISDAAGLFASNLAINVYTTSTVLIVSLTLGPTAAGLYALADKLRQAGSGIIDPIATVTYPFMCRIAGQQETAGETRTKRFLFSTIVCIASLISIGLFAFAPTIVLLIGGESFRAAIPVLRIIAFAPILIAVSNIVAVQTLIPMGMDREVTRIIIAAAIFSVGMTISLSLLIGLRGAALACLCVEAFVTISAIAVINRRQPVTRLFFGPLTPARKGNTTSL